MVALAWIRKEKKMKLHGLILNFGYVEEAVIGVLPIACAHEFEGTPEELLNGFLGDARKRYEEIYTRAACCLEAEKNKKRYCSECGTNIKNVRSDRPEFGEWLQSWLTHTNDSFAGKIRLDECCDVWNVGWLNHGNIVNVLELEHYLERNKLVYEVISMKRIGKKGL